MLAFGLNTVEGFVNNGNATGSPLVSVKSLSARVGLNTLRVEQTSYYTTIGRKVYFFGRDGGTRGDGLFLFDGSNFIRVSTPSIEKILQNAPDISISSIP
jgi:hypothetical protein